jgi:glycosyltransferase involved in cell wall biosynthesis
MNIDSLNNITVSVIMITYGHEKYIKQAIEGVLMQKCDFNIELIVANDCSNDTTSIIVQDILEKHPNSSWIKFIDRKKNIGGQNNFNDAFNQAKGRYIAHCEGDDYWTSSNKLQKQVNFLETNLDYVLTFHKVKILKKNGELVDDFITNVPEGYETKETLARLGNYIHTPSVVFRNIIKVLPYELNISPIGDYFLYMLLVEHGKLKCFEEEMAVYRYGIGIHSSQNNIKMAKSNLKLFTLLLSYFNEPIINKILLERQLEALDSFENLIRNEYSEAFVSNHLFFKTIKSLNRKGKFWEKIKAKFQ